MHQNTYHRIYNEGLCNSAIFENESGTHTCHKNLTIKKRLESSTWRELLAIKYALKSFAPLLQNTSIHLKTDNPATLVITRKGRNKTSLLEFTENIYKICVENSTKFEILWIPHNKTDFKTMKRRKQKNSILSTGVQVYLM